MTSGRIPGPYVHDVKEDRSLMYYDDLGWNVMDIGARKSGQPAAASKGPKSLAHVGGDQGAAGRHRASALTGG